ncbi:glycerate dehydrogenase [Trichodelitschia bisporula]|uniref:Glycerate dehydrogenase n=1 Tax=Trichodelitschia bisporula TaxID=703511 RepID=A0A6G1I5X7_9PEZI|nr:glycerate dehydrogenase [Trichodelitschia bisporula]
MSHSLAILDDYLSTSRPHFAHIPRSTLTITIFTDALPFKTPAEKAALVERLRPFTIISTMRERTPFPGSLLRELPNLKLLLCTGSQHQTFDFTTAKELGITVATATGKGRTDRPHPTAPLKKGVNSTTQHTWALILALIRNVAADDLLVKTGGWQSSLAMGLSGKTLGVVGLGRLGVLAARIAVSIWGMKVICWSENLTQEKADAAAQSARLPLETEDSESTFKVVSKSYLFRNSDIVSIHYVLSARSRGSIGADDLALMKATAFFINTSRGPLVNEDALLEVLRAGKIRGAALDVFDIEPLPLDSPWRTTEWGSNGTSRVLLSPHMGYVEEETINNWYAEAAENVERWLDGKKVLNILA